MVRRPRDAPAETALDRADVDDRLRAAIRVRRIVLPRRDPLQHRVEHLVHAQDRVLVALALAERRVDEVAVHADAQPERAEVAEHDLALGRLAEEAHVGDAAVRDEIARAGGVAAVLRARCASPYCVFSISPQTAAISTSPAQAHAGVLQRAHRLDVARERALHVRDAEPVEPAVAARTRAAGSPARSAARARAPSTTCPCGR